ncbi:MAG: type II toxin-antitoxin system HicA family toxin [Dehalococcoidia bacterium]|nr:type II toxin-antitoxin system HicA family toxin [Dehalococcoidia bacterium]
MPPLPVVSGREIVRALERDGWQYSRQRGSHMILDKPGVRQHLSIPNHREVRVGTLLGG